jgi:hypothetical protein
VRQFQTVHHTYQMLSQCLNGQFIVNQTLNISYCVCNPCYQGLYCADLIPNKPQMQFGTNYIYLIICLAGLCLSLLNNLLSLDVFLSSRIRRTNIGVYLIVGAIVFIAGSALLVIDRSIQYFKPYPFTNNIELSEKYHCFLEKSGGQITLFLCLWLSALVALERGLITTLDFKMNATRWRSVVTLLFLTCFTAATTITMLIYRCEYHAPHNKRQTRITSRMFYASAFIAGCIYVLATLLVLVSFALRISTCSTTHESQTEIFRRLLRKHLFIFIPSITYILCICPYQIWYSLKRPEQAFFQCEISTVEYSFKIAIQALTDLPTVITWLVFVYPSNVYMTEFYTATWSGKHARHLLVFFNEKFKKRTNQTLEKKQFWFVDVSFCFSPLIKFLNLVPINK